MENNKISGKTIGATVGFGLATLATMLLSSIISDKFVSNGSQIVEGVTQNIAAKKAAKTTNNQ